MCATRLRYTPTPRPILGPAGLIGASAMRRKRALPCPPLVPKTASASQGGQQQARISRPVRGQLGGLSRRPCGFCLSSSSRCSALFSASTHSSSPPRSGRRSYLSPLMICSSLYGHRVVCECDVLLDSSPRRRSLWRSVSSRAECSQFSSQWRRRSLKPFNVFGGTVARRTAKVPVAGQSGPNLVKDKARGMSSPARFDSRS
jgi:hypothetical protein